MTTALTQRFHSMAGPTSGLRVLAEHYTDAVARAVEDAAWACQVNRWRHATASRRGLGLLVDTAVLRRGLGGSQLDLSHHGLAATTGGQGRREQDGLCHQQRQGPHELFDCYAIRSRSVTTGVDTIYVASRFRRNKRARCTRILTLATLIARASPISRCDNPSTSRRSSTVR